MNTKSFKLAAFLCILSSGLSLHGADFGAILDQTAGYSGLNGGGEFDYSVTLTPRFSALLGDDKKVYVSAGLSYQTNKNLFVPELLRTEFSWFFGSGELTVGRMYYTDPLGLIADGLFDGAQVSFDTAVGSFNAGGWYTGLLYKNRANIAMTPEDALSNAGEFTYSDFAGTYFAPRRVLAALGWEHPNLGELFRTKVALLGQFDLSGGDLHSQYLAARFSMPLHSFVIDLGAGLELIQDGGDFGTAFAGELSFAWMPSGPFDQQLSLLGRFSSGFFEDSGIYAFQPLTTVPQGALLQGRFSGLSMISLGYTARFLQDLSANLSASYFIRSDLGSYAGYPAAESSKGYFLGNEFFARVFWSPVSDLQLNLGGGVFLPSLGDAAPDAGNLWRIELNVVLSF